MAAIQGVVGINTITRKLVAWPLILFGLPGLAGSAVANPPPLHAEAVPIPVLLIHGDRDSTVNPEQSTLMDAALTHAGKEHRLVVVQGADHYFSEDAYFEKMLSETGAFLHDKLDSGVVAR